MYIFGSWEILVNFFPFLLQGQNPNELYCCEKENDPPKIINWRYFNIHRRCSTLPIKTGVTLLQRLSREPGHECTPCVPWHFLSVLKLTVCGLHFLRATTAVPVHLIFYFYSNLPLECTKIFITSSVSQGLYFNCTFSSFLYLTAPSLNVDVSGETRHSSEHLKWRKINKCRCWTQVKSMAWFRSHVCNESQFFSIDSMLQVCAGSRGGSLFGNRNRTAWSTHNPGI